MCIITSCREQATVIIEGKYKLCATHADLPLVNCGRGQCNKIVAIGEQSVVGHRTYGPPSNVILCDDCDRLEKTRCGACGRIITVGGHNFTGRTTYPSPSSIIVCDRCEDLPKTSCPRCTKLLTVGDVTVAEGRIYPAPSNITVCVDCHALQTTRCANCTRVVTIGGHNFVQTSTYGAPSNIVLCPTCEALPKRNCAKCTRIVRIDARNLVALTPYPDQQNQTFLLCTTCVPTVNHRCRACGFPAGYTVDNVQRPLANASFIHREGDQTDIVGWRCPLCTVGPLRNTGEAQAAYAAAVQWMTNWVVNVCQGNYPAYGTRLEWSIDRDATFQMTGNGMELGHCVTTTGGGQPTHRIRVLFYMRPLSYQQTMLHELTHALTNETGIGNKALIEGFCNYVAYLYLRHVSQTGSPAERTEALRAMARMEANPDQTYGVGFRTVRDTLAQAPNTALTWLAST
jgi:uncharacterized protein YlaI